MKNLTLVLCFLPIALLAQKNNVFTIHSIPSGGVSLNKNWTWHAGDDSEWANPDFADSLWENMNINQSYLENPKIRNAEICWFRLHIQADSAIFNKSFISDLDVMGAAEVYLNGKLMQKVGIVSKDPKIEQTYMTFADAFSNISFDKKENLIAVRFSFSKGNIYFPLFIWTRTNPFGLEIHNVEECTRRQLRATIDRLFTLIPMMGFFLSLAFTHFAFFYFSSFQKANLWFGVTMATYAVFLYTFYYDNDRISISTLTVVRLIRQITLTSYHVLLVLAIHNYLKQPLTKGFWLTLVVALFGFAFLFFGFDWTPTLITTQYIFAFTHFYYLIILRKSIKEGNKDGLMIYYTGLICCLCLTIVPTLMVLNVLGIRHEWFGLLRNTCLYITNFSVTLGTSLTLGRDFARTNTSLQLKSKEVQQLSSEKLRIAADMHDDIGSDLSALNLKAEMIRQKVKAGKQPVLELDNLVDFTRDIAKKVREVIWTVNARNDSLLSIIHYFDTYAEDFFELTNIAVHTSLPNIIPDVIVNGDSRKILLTSFKESLHNVYKHAKASELRIAFNIDHKTLSISIQDNGVGFDPSVLTTSNGHKNGLRNLQERMASIGGQCVIKTSPQGTFVILSLPF